MEQYLVKIKSIKYITHDVLKVVTEKPPEFAYTPGQATEISINRNSWRDEKRPFTFTSLPHNSYLEFTIKTYPSHKGVTNELLKLKENDELILHDIFGTILYKAEGIFIAGGVGVTPFISIFRDLSMKKGIGNNKLIFANKTKEDIICMKEFETLLGKNFINILSDENTKEHAHGYIAEKFLKEYIDNSVQNVYVCGPPPMMDAVENILLNLKVDEKIIIKEEF